MIYFRNGNKLTGYQNYPETTDEPHIVVSNQDTIDKLSEVLEYVTLNESGLLTADFYETALALKDSEELDLVKAEKITELNSTCETEIISGFTSAALGSTHTYQSETTDQINLMGALASGLDQPYKCHNDAEGWAYRQHTLAQLDQVVKDGSTHKSVLLQKVQTLRDQVTNSTTKEEIDAITW